MSQVFFDAPYFSQSQGTVDRQLVSTFEPIDQAIAKEAIEAEKRIQKLPLETDNELYEQAFDDESMPRPYCNQEWVEHKGGGILVSDRKTKDHIRTLVVPQDFKNNDRTVVEALITKDKFFGLTQAKRILVWNTLTGDFIEQLALAHEGITQMALQGDKLIVATSKDRYLAVTI